VRTGRLQNTHSWDHLCADRVVDWMTGTIEYACPGFAHAGAGQREAVDLRKADSFSAGVILYELLTGTLPTPLPAKTPYADYSAYFSRRVINCLSRHTKPVTWITYGITWQCSLSRQWTSRHMCSANVSYFRVRRFKPCSSRCMRAGWHL